MGTSDMYRIDNVVDSINPIYTGISLAEIDPTGTQYMHVCRITKACTLEYKYTCIYIQICMH